MRDKEEKVREHRVWDHSLSVYTQDNISLRADVSDNFHDRIRDPQIAKI